MSKKSFVIILVLSVVVTYGVAFVDFLINKSKVTVGLPFGFSTFDFLGSETNPTSLFIDILFWFIVLWGARVILLKTLKR